MQDIQLVRENEEELKQNLKRRKNSDLLQKIDKVKEIDKDWREIKSREDSLRHQRNSISKKINKAKKEGKDIQSLIQQAKELPPRIEDVQQKREELKQERDRLLKELPNTLHSSVPYGESDEDNKEIKTWGEPKTPSFDLLPHQDLAESLGGADFTRSAKISGSGFYFLKGKIGLLNQAIIQFAINYLTQKDYTYHEPPLMMRRDAYETGVQLKDFDDVMYNVSEDDYLIATSEAPMLAQYKDETLKEQDLPLKSCAYSMCFRKEVGSHGIDTKGLFRTHQFNKVEQIIVSKPEDSWELHEELQKNAEAIHQLLELPYRVVNVCTGDLGSFASKKYDIEVWMPRQQAYKETCSNSNYTDYQARRANIRYHKEEDNTYPHVHTLNSTAVATGRILVAILENYQNEDGTLTVPKVLRPYLNGQKKIS